MSIASFSNIFYRGQESAVMSSPVQNGKIKVATDTARIFVDFTGLGRIEFTDFVRNFSSSEIEGGTIENPITSKIYIANDTGHLYVYIGSAFVDITNLKVTSAFSADSATYASTAGNATSATNANHASTADSATNATNATNAVNSNTALTAGKAEKDASGNRITTTYATINSPTLTGTPNAPTPASDDNSTQIATTAFVNSAIAAAIGGIHQFATVYVNTLPATGVDHTLYFVPDPQSTTDGHIEYIWYAPEGGTARWEKVGSTSVEAGVANVNVTGTGNAITGATVDSNMVLQLTKGSSFLTKHPTISVTSDTTNTGTVRLNGTVNVIDSITRDSNGHVTSKNTKTVTVSGPDCITYNSSNSTWDFNFGSLDANL